MSDDQPEDNVQSLEELGDYLEKARENLSVLLTIIDAVDDESRTGKPIPSKFADMVEHCLEENERLNTLIQSRCGSSVARLILRGRMDSGRCRPYNTTEREYESACDVVVSAVIACCGAVIVLNVNRDFSVFRNLLQQDTRCVRFPGLVSDIRTEIEQAIWHAREHAKASGNRHASDFRSAVWEGVPYTFTTMQAACVKILWELWEQGLPAIGESELLEQSGTDAEHLRHLFRGNPAWETMIISPNKGSFGLRINSPEN